MLPKKSIPQPKTAIKLQVRSFSLYVSMSYLLNLRFFTVPLYELYHHSFPIGPRPQTESDLKYAMRPEVASVNITETVAKALESLSPSLFRESL